MTEVQVSLSMFFAVHCFQAFVLIKSIPIKKRALLLMKIMGYPGSRLHIQSPYTQVGRDERETHDCIPVSKTLHCISHYPKYKAKRSSLVSVWSDMLPFFAGQFIAGTESNQVNIYI